MRYSVPCAHERGGGLFGTVSDYHPLTFDELVELLAIAIVADVQTFSSIQVRLGQAIPGMICPHPIDGEVAKRSVVLDSLFVYTPRVLLPGKAGEFWQLMH